jgi:hypothetical protein
MHMKLLFSNCFVAVHVVVLTATLCSGCGQKSSLGRVHGKVTLDGQPVPSGSVVTLPPAGRGAHGIIKNGEFELGTVGENDGAVLGIHKAAVNATEPSQGTGPEAVAGKSLLPVRYANPETSGLTIEVKAGDNTPTLELKSP